MGRARVAVVDDERSDATLVVDAGRGEIGAVEELYRRHAEAGWRVAQAVTANPDDASDAVSEAFARVLHALTTGRMADVSRFRPYFLATCRNVAIDAVRRAGRQQPVDSVGDGEAPGDGPQERAIARLDSRLVATAFRGLPERWRSVLWLTEVEGIPPRDAAELLGVSPNGVAQLAVRARNGLRERFLQAHLSDSAVDGACRATVRSLGAYADHSLAAREVAKVDQHLAGCDGCRRRLGELEDLQSSLRRIAVPLPTVLAASAVGRWQAGTASPAPGGRPDAGDAAEATPGPTPAAPAAARNGNGTGEASGAGTPPPARAPGAPANGDAAALPPVQAPAAAPPGPPSPPVTTAAPVQAPASAPPGPPSPPVTTAAPAASTAPASASPLGAAVGSPGANVLLPSGLPSIARLPVPPALPAAPGMPGVGLPAWAGRAQAPLAALSAGLFVAGVIGATVVGDERAGRRNSQAPRLHAAAPAPAGTPAGPALSVTARDPGAAGAEVPAALSAPADLAAPPAVTAPAAAPATPPPSLVPPLPGSGVSQQAAEPVVQVSAALRVQQLIVHVAVGHGERACNGAVAGPTAVGCAPAAPPSPAVATVNAGGSAVPDAGVALP